jgi:pimeloyl-ACP methyl ester carboxylesterase
MVIAAPPRLSSGYVQVGRMRLFHSWGGRGRPVLLIHGLGSSGYLGWRFALPQLALHNRVFAPDLPGFGRSDKPAARYGIPLFTRTMLRYLDAQGIDKATVVGASMGGRVALEMGLRHPRRVSRLVLVNSLGLGLPRYPFHGLFLLPRMGELSFRLMTAALKRLPAVKIRRLAARMGMVRNPERAFDDEYVALLRQIHGDQRTGRTYVATVRALFLLGMGSLSSELGRLQMPVNLIWGKNDPLFPLDQAVRAHRLLPGSELAVIEDAGHSPEAERPDEFNRALERFL